jgi:hypothetical protein
MNPTGHFTKGDVLYGRIHSDAIHPIIYLGEKNDDYFRGAMVTSTPMYRRRKNIVMSDRHIESHDENGKRYEFRFNNSHFVLANLIKKNEWQPFRKIGRLTPEGIEFVEDYINPLKERLFEEYDSSTNI